MNKKTFVKSIATAIISLGLLTSCNAIKGKNDAHKCGGKNSCKGSKTEKNACNSSNSCSSNGCSSKK